uniref:G-protein coupled receptors family 2 profile 2 domain-containing protein n=1 Tax=Amphimedon queenslandica TaxID=400682 RepID=A0A1X7UJX4_AMPQE
MAICTFFFIMLIESSNGSVAEDQQGKIAFYSLWMPPFAFGVISHVIIIRFILYLMDKSRNLISSGFTRTIKNKVVTLLYTTIGSGVSILAYVSMCIAIECNIDLGLWFIPRDQFNGFTGFIEFNSWYLQRNQREDSPV